MPAPDRDLDRTISHLLSTAEVNSGHLDVHLAAAAGNQGDPGLLAHHLHHAAAHAGEVSSHLVKLRDAVTRRVPAVGAELDDLDEAIPGSRATPEDHVPRGALDMSIAHDLASGQAAAAHVSRHLAEAQTAQRAGNKASVAFNIEHATHHVAEIAHALSELDADLARRIPAVAGETQKLHAAVAGIVTPAPPCRSAPADYGVEARRRPEPA